MQNVVSGAGDGWTSVDSLTGSHTDWVQLDLGAATTLGQVTLAPRKDSNYGYGFPTDFTIALSTDGSTWTTVTTESAVSRPSTGADQVYTFAPQTARYIRVTGTARTKPDDSGYYRMQLKQIRAYAPSTTPTSAHWVQLAFPATTTFDQVALYPRDDSGHVDQDFPVSFTVAVSNDGATWTTVSTQSNVTPPAAGSPLTVSFAARSAKFVRVTGTSPAADPNSSLPAMQLAELGVYDN